MKVKFNVKGVEVRRGGGEPIPKGVYLCTVDSCEVTKPPDKDQRIEVVYAIKDGDHKGRKLFDYINLVSEQSQWKLREFLEAMGIVTGKKEAGEFDPARMVNKEVKINVVHQAGKGEYEGTINSRVGSVMPADEEEEDGEDLDEDGEDEEDEEDEVDLDEMERPELKKFIKEQELGITVKRGWSDDELREAIAEALKEDDEDEDEDEDQDYSEMDEDELVATLKERGLKTTGSKKLKISRLEKYDETSDDDGDPF